MISNVFTYYNDLNYSNKSSIHNCYCNNNNNNNNSKSTNQQQTSTLLSNPTRAEQQQQQQQTTTRPGHHFEPPTNSIPIVMTNRNPTATRRTNLTEPNSPIHHHTTTTTTTTQRAIVDLSSSNQPAQHLPTPLPLAQSLARSNIIPIRQPFSSSATTAKSTSGASASSSVTHHHSSHHHHNNTNSIKNGAGSGSKHQSDMSSNSSYNSPPTAASQQLNYNMRTGVSNNNNNNNNNNKNNDNNNNNGESGRLHQSSSSNLSVLGSSVPATCGGSYAGVYKRFMRSISNSLISSNGNLAAAGATASNMESHIEGGSFNAAANPSEFETGSQPAHNYSNSNSVWNNQASLCEKCVENNCYPKYKVGVSIMFCLPGNGSNETNSNQTKFNDDSPINGESTPLISQTPTPLPANSSLNAIPFLNSTGYQNNSNRQPPMPTLSSSSRLFDPLVLFPATSSSSSSPPTSTANSPSSNIIASSVGKNSAVTTINNNNENDVLTTPVVDSTSPSSITQSSLNEDFYEFFFSHLPIIEYQFKELRERIMRQLPFYFNSPKFHQNHSHYYQQHHRNSVTSQTSNGSGNGNKSLNSSTLNLLTTSGNSSIGGSTTTSNPTGLSFTRQMLVEFETFEHKFNMLYHSPRLTSPAWLSLINTKRVASSPVSANPSSTTVNNNNNKRSILNISNNLIGDLNFLNSVMLLETTRATARLVTVPKTTPNSSGGSSSNDHNSYLGHIFQNIKNFYSNNNNNNNNNQSNGSGDPSSTSSSLTVNVNNNNNNYNRPSLNSIFDSSSTIATSLGASVSNKNSGRPSHFLSTLLSTILKHHLSWVYTVLPSSEETATNDSTTANLRSKLRKQRANWTSVLEKTNPYNPLWAQLSDLHGAVNQPLRLVRTVVVGRDRELVERVLFFLSYFIRCGNSSYFDIAQEHFDFEKLSSLSANANASELDQHLSMTSEPGGDSPSSNDNNSHLTTANVTKTLAENSLATNTSSSESSDSSTASSTTSRSTREVDLTDLKYDPVAQLSLIIGVQTGNSSEKTNAAVAAPATVTRLSVSSISPPDQSLFHLHNHNGHHDSKPGHSKRRHVSSSSNGMNCNAQELPLIGCKLKQNHVKSTRMQDNFGYSLLASFCEEFVFEFVLHGTSDRSFLNDLQHRISFCKNVSFIYIYPPFFQFFLPQTIRAIEKS
jgi:hypothetical protein